MMVTWYLQSVAFFGECKLVPFQSTLAWGPCFLPTVLSMVRKHLGQGGGKRAGRKIQKTDFPGSSHNGHKENLPHSPASQGMENGCFKAFLPKRPFICHWQVWHSGPCHHNFRGSGMRHRWFPVYFRRASLDFLCCITLYFKVLWDPVLKPCHQLAGHTVTQRRD